MEAKSVEKQLQFDGRKRAMERWRRTKAARARNTKQSRKEDCLGLYRLE
jgi:hypothetical protein